MKSRTDINRDEIDSIIASCQVCCIGMVDKGNEPYVLPFNFGYSDGRLYIHSGPGGRKEEVWRSNGRVCVSFSNDYQMRIQNESVACSYSMRYRSVLVFGSIVQVLDPDEKVRILNVIMQKYTNRSDFTYSKPALSNVCVFEIVIDRMEGRVYGY